MDPRYALIRRLRAVCLGVAAAALLALQPVQAAELTLKAPASSATPPVWVPMFGDFIGSTVGIDTPINTLRGALKITENESPRPVDRVFINYNYYGNVNANTVAGGLDVHREMFGFEKTFLDGNASFGVRMPFLQLSNQDGGQSGDISLIGKYAWINQPGAVLTTGLVMTLPTSSQPLAFDFARGQAIRSTVFQPFVGGFYSITPDIFVQGFSSVAVPTDSRDVTMWFNSAGVGYFAYRAGPTAILNAVIPTVELHVNTPLNHRDAGIPDPLETIVNLTGGAHIQIFNGGMLGFAVGVPLNGPRIYDVEGITSFNWRF